MWRLSNGAPIERVWSATLDEASGAAQIALFLISVPYTWSGGGGSIGNRYFMGAYGAFLFLLPPIQRVAMAFVPWVAGLFFMAPLVMNPFAISARPGDASPSSPGSSSFTKTRL